MRFATTLLATATKKRITTSTRIHLPSAEGVQQWTLYQSGGEGASGWVAGLKRRPAAAAAAGDVERHKITTGKDGIFVDGRGI
jgi:hypothetical protein